MTWWIWLVLAVLLLFACAVAFYFCVALVRMPERQSRPLDKDMTWGRFAARILADTETVRTWPAEAVSIRSFDGLTLRGSYYTQPGARGTVVLMHGYRGQSLRDFAWIMPFYRALGLNMLLPDQRSHGQSEGRYITFGVKERLDCRDWVLWLNRRTGEGQPVFLHGVSMGGATVLMTTGLVLPSNVRGVVDDCGFISPRAIMAHVCRVNYHTPTFPIMPLCELLAKLLAGFGFDDCSTLDCVRRTDLPILFIHGTADSFVPTEMSRENYAACNSEKELVLVEGATHAVSYMVDQPKYEAALRAFIEKHLHA